MCACVCMCVCVCTLECACVVIQDNSRYTKLKIDMLRSKNSTSLLYVFIVFLFPRRSAKREKKLSVVCALESPVQKT